MTDRTKIHLDLDVLNDWFKKLQTEEPPNGMEAITGFDQTSVNNEYMISLRMNKAGQIEISIKPATTYEKLEQMTYAEIEEQYVNS